MLNQDLIDVTKANDESYVKDWTDKLVATLPNNIAEGVFYKSKVDFDPVENIYFPVIVNHIHGMDYEYKLDAKFLASSNFIELSKLNKITNGFIKPDGYVEVGTKIVPVSTFKDAYELMIKEGFKGYSVQRYKGLGEMSAEQLSKTTMDPDTRRVMQVDPKTADEAYIVLEQLMGEDVEYRKQFIGENFKSASLDV
jgi:DNA gyrase subunit B